MRISHRRVKEEGDIREISAEIDGFRLWYRAPRSRPVSEAADPFLAAALLPAMAKGEGLEIEPGWSVSARMLGALPILQDIHHAWNPVLKIVPIAADAAPTASLGKGALSFFSGGVDSMYTFLKRRDEVTNIVYIQGFDFRVDDASFRTALERNEAFARRFGKEVIPVWTNFRDFGYHHNLSILLTQGSALAAIAHVVGLPRAFISSAYSYGQLIPCGSHPLTDPLWSSESVEIVHEGAELRRVDKVVRIAREPAFLDGLQVCAREVARNCGRCEKCLRTMVPLRLVGAVSAAFPPFPPLREIRKLRIPGEIEMIFFRENCDLAERMGDDRIRRALRACLRRHERARFLKDVDRVLLRGAVKKAYRALVRDVPVDRRITTTPPQD